MTASPRDTFVTLYGRIPVLEALANERVEIDKVLVARNAHGDTVDEILATARRRGIAVQRVGPEKVTRISRNGRQDQGVVADVIAPGVEPLDDWLARTRVAGVTAAGAGHPPCLLVLDGITTPANVGMIIRTVAAAGLEGVVLPRAGSPDVGPLVVKASAGTALFAPVLRAATAAEAVASLRGAGFRIVGLQAFDATPLYSADLEGPTALVLGNESDGLSPAVAGVVDAWVSIPMAPGVESLNVAVAGSIVAYEIVRRRSILR